MRRKASVLIERADTVTVKYKCTRQLSLSTKTRRHHEAAFVTSGGGAVWAGHCGPRRSPSVVSSGVSNVVETHGSTLPRAGLGIGTSPVLWSTRAADPREGDEFNKTRQDGDEGEVGGQGQGDGEVR